LGSRFDRLTKEPKMFATQADQYEAPVTLADAHSQWHSIHGQVVCPLDCGIGDAEGYDYDDAQAEVWGVQCGFCKARLPRRCPGLRRGLLRC
jgi:hypothetical protein